MSFTVNHLAVWRLLTLVSFFGLMVIIIVWNGWLTPVQYLNRGLEIALLEFPLLFFVRGVINGEREKHIAITLLSLLYFFIGVWFIFAPQESLYGYGITCLSIGLYLGSFFYVRAGDKLAAL
jgi:uncharacterized membrane protein